MRTSLLVFTFSLVTATNAQFASGFETWNDTVPTDWIGVKTNINLDSIAQVAINPHGGNYAVRLTNPSVNNKRLSTQPVALDSGTVYEYSLWVRGHGDVHVSLFDERGAPGGIATYSTYVTVADDAVWQEVTASVLCTHNSAVGEFIIGVRNTAGPEHLVVDDVNVLSSPLAITARENIHSMNVFPNPATDVFTIALNDVSDGPAYTLTDAVGRVAALGTVRSTRELIDIQGLTPGMYMLTVGGASRIERVKLQVR
jgi:Secretion system C-terminal sorting domain